MLWSQLDGYFSKLIVVSQVRQIFLCQETAVHFTLKSSGFLGYDPVLENPEDLNLQQHCCTASKSRILPLIHRMLRPQVTYKQGIPMLRVMQQPALPVLN
jgi:hypothetical protein